MQTRKDGLTIQVLAFNTAYHRGYVTGWPDLINLMNAPSPHYVKYRVWLTIFTIVRAGNWIDEPGGLNSMFGVVAPWLMYCHILDSDTLIRYFTYVSEVLRQKSRVH